MKEVKATTVKSFVAEVMNSIRSSKGTNAAPMNLAHEFCSADQRTRLAVELVKDPLNELKEAVMNQLPVTASHPNLVIGVALTSNTGTKEKGLEVHDGLKKTVKTASKLDANR
ncbi:hypothetical protein M0R45_016175 [Rubus argutus]|uniref:Uncharacterized protein n=1 Tax=Rubus argutus TaxID=59490 RepID=A0AAW1XUB1_RUBAR